MKHSLVKLHRVCVKQFLMPHAVSLEDVFRLLIMVLLSLLPLLENTPDPPLSSEQLALPRHLRLSTIPRRRFFSQARLHARTRRRPMLKLSSRFPQMTLLLAMNRLQNPPTIEAEWALLSFRLIPVANPKHPRKARLVHTALPTVPLPQPLSLRPVRRRVPDPPKTGCVILHLALTLQLHIL